MTQLNWEMDRQTEASMQAQAGQFCYDVMQFRGHKMDHYIITKL